MAGPGVVIVKGVGVRAQHITIQRVDESLAQLDFLACLQGIGLKEGVGTEGVNGGGHGAVATHAHVRGVRGASIHDQASAALTACGRRG